MRKIFRLAGILAAGAAVVSLTACSGASDATQNLTSNSAATEATENNDANFNVGKTEGSKYANDFFGISFNAPEEWRLLNEEQLGLINNNIKDVLTADEAKTAIENGKTSVIMYAVSKDSKQNASLTVEKHEINNTQDVDLDSFLDKAITSLKNNLPGQGFSDLSVEKATVSFCGTDTPALKIKGKYGAEGKDIRDIYETQIYMFNGSYSGCITTSSFDEDKSGDILQSFSRSESPAESQTTEAETAPVTAADTTTAETTQNAS